MLFERLLDTANLASLRNILSLDAVFHLCLERLLNHMGVPANNDPIARVYSMSAQQRADFDNYYSITPFYNAITMLLMTVELDHTSTPFSPTVTPDSTPDSSPHGTPGRDGNGGNPGGGGGGAGAAAPPPAV